MPQHTCVSQRTTLGLDLHFSSCLRQSILFTLPDWLESSQGSPSLHLPSGWRYMDIIHLACTRTLQSSGRSLHVHSKHYPISTAPGQWVRKGHTAGVWGWCECGRDVVCMRHRSTYSSGAPLGWEARVESWWKWSSGNKPAQRGIPDLSSESFRFHVARKGLVCIKHNTVI